MIFDMTKRSGGGGDAAVQADSEKMQIAFPRGALREDVVINMPNTVIGINQMLLNASASNANTSVTITAKQIVSDVKSASVVTDVANICQSASNITTLTLNADSPICAGSQFIYNSSIKRVLGTPIIANSFGASTGSRRFNNTNLEEFYLVPNTTVEGGAGINTGVLVDDCLISVANALKEGLGTTQTLTISNATTKAKCGTIVGTVSEVTENEVTYHVFTADPNGTTTLTSFITATKGWTLA